MDLSPDDIEASVLYQVAAVAGFARAHGTALRHVKAHGALYNLAARDGAAAAAIARAVQRSTRRSPSSASRLGAAVAGREAGLAVRAEAFADRAYEPDGTLRGRHHADALLGDPDATARQAVRIACEGRVTAIDGTDLEVAADTLCVHGDAPGAAARAAAVRAALAAAGVEVRAPGERPG